MRRFALVPLSLVAVRETFATGGPLRQRRRYLRTDSTRSLTVAAQMRCPIRDRQGADDF